MAHDYPTKYQFRGEWRTARQIADITGWNLNTIYKRRRGTRVFEAKEVEAEERNRLLTNHPNAVYLSYEGKRLSLKGWSEELSVSYPTLCGWHQRGMTIKEMVAEARLSRECVAEGVSRCG